MWDNLDGAERNESRMRGSHVMCETKSQVKEGRGYTEWRFWDLGALQVKGRQILENRSTCVCCRKLISNNFSKA